jgi:hypothetical protein
VDVSSEFTGNLCRLNLLNMSKMAVLPKIDSKRTEDVSPGCPLGGWDWKEFFRVQKTPAGKRRCQLTETWSRNPSQIGKRPV